MDYFINRYHSSIQGRFTSVDPENVGADPEYPQTWNGYSYTVNNPVTYSDPDGLKVKICDTNGNCTEISDDDANKYFFNKKYQREVGYYVKGGKVYDANKNLIGTYQNICCDHLPDWNVGVLNHTRDTLSDPWVWGRAMVGTLYRPYRGGNTSGGITGRIGPERQLGTRLPQHAERTLEHIERTGRAPTGYRGGRRFQNDGRAGGEVLPRTDANGNAVTYREWDVNALQPGVNRGAERLVTGSDGSAYYTNDHYRTFIKIK